MRRCASVSAQGAERCPMSDNAGDVGAANICSRGNCINGHSPAHIGNGRFILFKQIKKGEFHSAQLESSGC